VALWLPPSPPLYLISIQWLARRAIFYCQTTAKFRGLEGTDYDQLRVIPRCICSGNRSTLIRNCGLRRSSFHRLFDRVNIGVRCSLEPRGVHAQHYLDAVSVLLRDPEHVFSEHELPGHRGMPRVIGSAPANTERLDALAPAPAGDLRVADRPAVFEEKEMLMRYFSGRDVFRAERQVPS
jgi:hypothetical protein